MSERDAVIEAIATIRKHLADEWIVEGCRKERVWTCASCQAVELDRDLEALLYEIELDNGDRPDTDANTGKEE